MHCCVLGCTKLPKSNRPSRRSLPEFYVEKWNNVVCMCSHIFPVLCKLFDSFFVGACRSISKMKIYRTNLRSVKRVRSIFTVLLCLLHLFTPLFHYIQHMVEYAMSIFLHTFTTEQWSHFHRAVEDDMQWANTTVHNPDDVTLVCFQTDVWLLVVT